MLRVEAPVVSLAAALLSSRTPSISMAVPNEALPFSCVLLRRAILLSSISVGLTVLPPGSRVAMSPMLSICCWSRAVRSMVYEVVASSCLRLAVTVTSSSRRSSGFSLMLSGGMSLVMVMGSVCVAYPRHWMVSVALPVGTPLMTKRPSASVMAHLPFSFIRILTNSTGSRLLSSTTLPATAACWALAVMERRERNAQIIMHRPGHARLLPFILNSQFSILNSKL